jgi:hypothetical protein
MRVAIFSFFLAFLFNSASGQCDIATTGVAIVSAANNTTPVSSICIGQQAKFKFSIANFGSDPNCTIPTGSVVAVFDFPSLGSGVKPYIYNGLANFTSTYFTWTYNSIANVLTATNHSPIPNGLGETLLIPVLGNAAGAGSSNLNMTQNFGVTDNAGNNFGGAQLTVNALPVVSCPSSFTVCPGSSAFTLTGGSPGGGTYTGIGVSGGQFNPVAAGVGTHTITYTVTNGTCSNSCNFTITVDDIIPPVISALPTPSIIECPASPSFATPTATDACGTPTLTFADVSTPGSCANEYSVTRTWTATDGNGNTSSASQTITVEDNTGPVISGVGSNASIECPALPVFSTPVSTDACGSSTLTFTDVSTPGSCANEYSVTRTWTATDACGNTSEASQTITIEDNTGPVISGVGINASIECPAFPVFSTPTSTDACGSSTLTFTDVSTPGSCVDEYSVTRTWTATDACGNTSEASQTITIEDNTGPVISGVGISASIECPAFPVFSTPASTDACGSSTLTFADVSTPGSCANEYSVTRTWTATDACGNTSEASQTITIEDNTGPVISALPAPSIIECPASPSFTTPTSLDACGSSTLTFADVSTPGSCVNEYSVTRTWTATDACGNTSEASQTITVEDNTGPVISGVGINATIECPALPVFSTPTSTDACGSSTLTFADVSTPGSCVNEYSVTRTWTAMDACGNTSEASQTIAVEDNTGPVISGVGVNENIECPALPVFSSPTSLDACGSSTLTFADVSTPGSCVNEYSVTRTWTATDACGNTSEASQTITIEDNTGPVISGVGINASIECPALPVFSTPVSTDACGSSTLTFADVSTPGSCVNEYSVTRTWTATDACGNTSEASQTITVEDNTGPVISGVGISASIECPAFPVFSTPASLDACGSSTLTFADVSTPGSCVNEYSVTRTWTATDACGNTSEASQTITVEDNTGPVISALPAPSIIECPALPVFSTPTSLDACGSSTLTFADISTPGSCVNEYSVTRTWTATDACGNTSEASQTIAVEDNTGPVISALPAPSIIECPALPVFSTPTSTDACGSSTLTFTDVSTPGSCVNEYSVTRTWTATDACGNTSEASQTITVEDNTGPVISGVGINASIECPALPVFSTPTSLDACGSSTLIFTDVSTPGSCVNEYSVTRTWTATDACGNTSEASQTITVEDNTGPVISVLPAPSIIECPASPTFATPTALDACGSSTLTFADVSTPGSCVNEYIVTRTWTATDACGNTSEASQTITVEDNTGPVISGVGINATIECPALPVFSTPTSLDACGSSTLTFADVSTPGSCVNEYSVTRTWTATDACGNTSETSQTITVEDNTGPVISGVGINATIECPALPVFSTPISLDACGSSTLTFADVSTPGSCVNEYSVTRTWTATDACGNTSEASQTIAVEDNTGPVISALPAPSIIECPASPSFTTPTSTDACGSSTLTFADVSTPGSCVNEYSVTRTWTATDACGNTSSASQTITVEDNTAPVVNDCPSNMTINSNSFDPSSCTQVVSWTEPTALDNCSGALTYSTRSHAPGSSFPVGSTTVTYTFTDACSNTSTCTFTVTVVDNTNPVFDFCPSPVINANPNAPGCTYTTTLTDPAVHDNCTVSSLTWSMTGGGAMAPLTGSGSIGIHSFGLGLTTIVYTATDPSGNSSTCTFTVSVVNALAGSISGTTTVIQNAITSSPITFSGSGGALPYTFTYTINGGSNQTVTTTGINTSAVVQQSNATLGQFIYALVSITDGNGCTGTVPADNKDTVTVITGRPDLFSAVSNPLNSQFINGQVKEGVVTLSNAAVNQTTGTITFRISYVANFDLEILDGTTLSAGVGVNNSDWNISAGILFYTLTSKPGVVINGGFASSKIGFKLTAIGSTNSSGIMTVTIINDTGGTSPGTGDSNNNNNQSVKLFTIN